MKRYFCLLLVILMLLLVGCSSGTALEIDTTRWVDIGGLRIPPTWSSSPSESGGPPGDLDITGEGVGGSIRMFYGYGFAGSLEMLIEDSISSQAFLFDDMHSGYMLDFPDRIIWVRESYASVLLYHDGDRSIFTDNEDLILKVARTLEVEYGNAGGPQAQQTTRVSTAHEFMEAQGSDRTIIMEQSEYFPDAITILPKNEDRKFYSEPDVTKIAAIDDHLWDHDLYADFTLIINEKDNSQWYRIVYCWLYADSVLRQVNKIPEFNRNFAYVRADDVRTHPAEDYVINQIDWLRAGRPPRQKVGERLNIDEEEISKSVTIVLTAPVTLRDEPKEGARTIEAPEGLELLGPLYATEDSFPNVYANMEEENWALIVDAKTWTVLGWIRSEQLSEISDWIAPEDFYSQRGVVLGDRLRMRTDPNTSATIIRQLDKDTMLEVLDSYKAAHEGYPWYKVRYAGDTGWVYGEFLKVD